MHEAHINWWSLGSAYSENPAMGWYMITFAVFVGAVIYYVRTPLALFFETRSNDLRKAIEEARIAKAESEARLREYEGRLKTLDAEIAKMKSEFEKQGEIERAQLKVAAEAMAAQIAKDAKDSVAAEVHHAKVMLRRHLADSVVNLAQQNVARRMEHHMGQDAQNAFIRGI